jgi:hypothetical protein
MKRFQSVLCASVLALSLSSTVLAGNIHVAASSGNIHVASANGILISDVFTWGNISGILVNGFGIILGN